MKLLEKTENFMTSVWGVVFVFNLKNRQQKQKQVTKYIKLKVFFTAKERISKMKRQPMG
jgi:hypothetical protein